MHLARHMEAMQGEPGAEIVCSQQWTPEYAERLSHAEMAIFVDASATILPGEVQVRAVSPDSSRQGVTSHSMSPAQLLALAQQLYGRVPARSFLVTIGGESFAHDRQLSTPVRLAIPAALARIRELLGENQSKKA